MKLTIEIPGHVPASYVLEDFLVFNRTFVTLGRKSDEAYNCIAMDSPSVGLFQCQFQKDADGRWTVRSGQLRTECPKGIRSDRQIACNTCTGRCVNIRPGRPEYHWRHPEVTAMINGTMIPDQPLSMKTGDRIDVGDVRIMVD